MTAATFSHVLSQKEVVICVGAGGVGKTTISAALALRGSLMRRRSLVCTIDPAKRLANSLGLESLGNTETEINPSQLAQADLPTHGHLFAMMLDMKRSWDEFIEQNVPAGKRERILQNRFYQSLSTALAGSQEYIAMEKLWQLRNKSTYGLIVLDTPPTSHAIDFFDAPNRLLDFLDNDFARVALAPAMAAGKIGLKLFNFGSSYLTKALANVAGTETLEELANFLFSIESLNEKFRNRAKQTRDMLASPSTAFVLVTAPGRERLDEAEKFHRLLIENQMKPTAIVVNRVHPPLPKMLWEMAKEQAEPVRSKLSATLTENNILAKQDAAGVDIIKSFAGTTPVIQIPRFPLDVHDLKSLWHTSQYLLGEKTIVS